MGSARDEREALMHMEHVFRAHGRIEFAGRDAWTQEKVLALEAVDQRIGGIDSILDLGPGNLEPLLAWPGFATVSDYVGVEGSPLLMERQRQLAPEQPGRTFYNLTFGNWVALGVPRPRQFDVVLALDMLYHIPSNDIHDRVLEQVFEARRAVILTYSQARQDFGGRRVGQGGFAWFPRPEVGSRIERATQEGWELVWGAEFKGGPQKQLLAALVKGGLRWATFASTPSAAG